MNQILTVLNGAAVLKGFVGLCKSCFLYKGFECSRKAVLTLHAADMGSFTNKSFSRPDGLSPLIGFMLHIANQCSSFLRCSALV